MNGMSGAAAKVEKNVVKKPNHDAWNARMCGLLQLRIGSAVALCSAGGSGESPPQWRGTDRFKGAQHTVDGDREAPPEDVRDTSAVDAVALEARVKRVHLGGIGLHDLLQLGDCHLRLVIRHVRHGSCVPVAV